MRFELMEDRRMLAPVTVASNSDVVNGNVASIGALIANPGADGISLREAIMAANVDAALDTITFSPFLDGAQILLNLANGQINITNPLTIDGSSLTSGITLNGNDPTPAHTGQGIRIFDIRDVTNGANPPLITLVGLTLKGGDVGVQSPQGPEGGAIRSAARLVIRDCTFEQNEANIGGAIFVEVAGGATPRELLRIENSTISNNTSDGGGGIEAGWQKAA